MGARHFLEAGGMGARHFFGSGESIFLSRRTAAKGGLFLRRCNGCQALFWKPLEAAGMGARHFFGSGESIFLSRRTAAKGGLFLRDESARRGSCLWLCAGMRSSASCGWCRAISLGQTCANGTIGSNAREAEIIGSGAG